MSPFVAGMTGDKRMAILSGVEACPMPDTRPGIITELREPDTTGLQVTCFSCGHIFEFSHEQSVCTKCGCHWVRETGG